MKDTATSLPSCWCYNGWASREEGEMKKLILAGFLTLLTGCTQQAAAPKVSYGPNYIKPGGSLGSTATFTTTSNNTFTSQTQVAFNNAISYGAAPSTPIFAANTFYSCASATPASSIN